MSAYTLEVLNPANLTIDINVRTDANLTPEFLASIKEHGVLQPVIAHRTTPDSTPHVLMGQRRTLAAVENQLSTIPVYIVETLEEADRLAQQVVENDQRTALTDHDRANAFHQMSLLGVSPETIARRTGSNRDTVDKALIVRQNETASQALEYGMTIEQAATIEEFSDNTQYVETLTTCATNNPGQFEHRAQQFREELKTNALIELLKLEGTEAGLTFIDEHIDYYDYRGPVAKLHEVKHADGSPVLETEADAFYISRGYSGPSKQLVIADWKASGFHKGDKAPNGMTDEQKAERAALIANNKAMDAAIIVRQEFVKTLLQAKKLPKDSPSFIVWTLANASNRVNNALGRKSLAAELLGEEPEYNAFRDYVNKPNTNPEKATLALMLSAYEGTCDRQDWRYPQSDMATYLTTLETWGYQVSEVEQIVIDNIK